MFLLERPSSLVIDRILAEQRGQPLTYREVGVTRNGGTSILRRTQYRTRVGTGERDYVRAVAAMQSWRMYANGWTEIHPSGVAPEPDAVFATVVQHLGIWSVNPCRVIYVEQDTSDARMTAFAIGTLPKHAERGEERFQVEWKRSDDSVWFEILAYAEPQHWLAVLGTPYVLHLQREFAKQALVLMQASTQ
jgi:uncharacterized protein (UPF0548 family)